MLCAAHALFGPVNGRVFEEGRGVRMKVAWINHTWWRGCVIFLPYFSLVIERPSLPILIGQKKRLHLDVGPLSQVLDPGWLGGHDRLGPVHPGRGLGLQIAVRLLPPPQLIEMLLLNVLLSHVQLNNLKQRRSWAELFITADSAATRGQSQRREGLRLQKRAVKWRQTITCRSDRTSCARKLSCMYCGCMARRSCIVS